MSGNENGSSFVFVSLYLVLLSFFILLNSFSSIHADKLSQTAGSLRSAFKGIHTMENNFTNTIDIFEDTEEYPPQFLPIINIIPSSIIDISYNKYSIKITSAIQDIFTNTSSKITPEFAEFLTNLSTEIIKIDPNLHIKILTNKKTISDNNISIQIKQISLIKSTLLQNGIKLSNITSGIKHSSEDDLSISIY